MQLNRKLFKRALLTTVALAVTIIAFKSNINYMYAGRGAAPDSIFYAKTIFKTIPGSNTDLLGFELHKRVIKTGNDCHTEYNVVMRNLDPQTDTYKVYCQDIIKDVVSSAGEKNGVTVNVFDSFEAYSFYASDAQMRLHNNNELLAAHLVATYEDGTADNGTYCHLTYYPYASDYLRETGGCNWL